MSIHEKYMNRCLDLARLGLGNVSPNPMVGCVIVYNDTVIGEGFHQKYGEVHAEVNAINAVKNNDLLQKSTLYVSLEPCAHYGLTPPCSDLIIEKKIPNVIIGTIDSFAKVAGKGIAKMEKAGINVQVGVLQNECRDINKRFFTFFEKKRPYIVLKWAETIDGFIDFDRAHTEYGEPSWITGEKALLRVHQMRATEDAILVGTNTALKDNPSLTVRHCEGTNPIRLVIDNKLRLPKNLHLFDKNVKTLVFNSIKDEENGNMEFIKINFDKNIIPQVLKTLYIKRIQSVIIEGGKQLLDSFIQQNLWDEVFRFVGNSKFNSGIKAPVVSRPVFESEEFDSDKLHIYKNSSIR